MTPIILNSPGGNHPPEAYASALARTIFQIDPNISVERGVAAQNLLNRIAQVLTPHFNYVLKEEAEKLTTFVDHCDSNYAYLEPLARYILRELQQVAVNTPWEAKLKDAEWALVALNTIASHLASAVHVERLLFGDANPNNPAAVAYKARTTGAS
jgi:hypothetical protein